MAFTCVKTGRKHRRKIKEGGGKKKKMTKGFQDGKEENG